eukprot:462544_1
MNQATAKNNILKEIMSCSPASLFPFMANEFPVALGTPSNLRNTKNELKQLTADEIGQLKHPGESSTKFKAPWENDSDVKVWRCKPVADMIKQSLARKIWVPACRLKGLGGEYRSFSDAFNYLIKNGVPMYITGAPVRDLLGGYANNDLTFGCGAKLDKVASLLDKFGCASGIPSRRRSVGNNERMAFPAFVPWPSRHTVALGEPATDLYSHLRVVGRPDCFGLFFDLTNGVIIDPTGRGVESACDRNLVLSSMHHGGIRLSDVMSVLKLHVTRNYVISDNLMGVIMDDISMSYQVYRVNFARYFRGLLNSVQLGDHPKMLNFINDGLKDLFYGFPNETPLQLTLNCAMVERQQTTLADSAVIPQQKPHLLMGLTSLEEQYTELCESETPIYMLIYLPAKPKSQNCFFKMMPDDATVFDAKIAVYTEKLANDTEEDVTLLNLAQTTLGPLNDDHKLKSLEKHDGCIVLQADVKRFDRSSESRFLIVGEFKPRPLVSFNLPGTSPEKDSWKEIEVNNAHFLWKSSRHEYTRKDGFVHTVNYIDFQPLGDPRTAATALRDNHRECVWSLDSTMSFTISWPGREGATRTVDAAIHMNINEIGRLLLETGNCPSHAYAFYCTLDELDTEPVRELLEIDLSYELQWGYLKFVVRWIPKERTFMKCHKFTIPWNHLLGSDGVRISDVQIADHIDMNGIKLVKGIIHKGPNSEGLNHQAWKKSNIYSHCSIM